MSVDGLYNFRDTGGMPLSGGGSTRAGVLFRSDALTGLTPQGEEQLAATPVGVIVDFRTPQERESGPDRIPASRPFRSVELSILQGAVAEMAKDFLGDGATTPSPEAISAAMTQLPTIDELYIGMLQGGASAFAQVARLIGASTDDAPTAVLVHCTAGKDRTGVAAALMLSAVGAEREAVVADYASSQRNLAGPWADGMVHMVESFGIPMTPAFHTLLTGTPPEAMETALDWVAANHGDAAGYLASGGLTDDELGALRARLAA